MKEFKRTAYSEKLRDPRWQKMRLEVFNRDDWRCCVCGTKEVTLNVHHRWYERGQEPWEASLDQLVTLCEDCHGNESNNRRADEERLLATLRRFYYSHDLYQIEKVFLSMPLIHVGEVQLTAVAWYLSCPEKMQAVMDEYWANNLPNPVGWGELPHTIEAANRFKPKPE